MTARAGRVVPTRAMASWVSAACGMFGVARCDNGEGVSKMAWAGVAGVAGLVAARALFKGRSEMDSDMAAMAALGEKLSRALDSARADLGDPPLPMTAAVPALGTIVRHWSDAVAANPGHLSDLMVDEVIANIPGARETTGDDLDELTEHLPLACAAYEPTDKLEEALRSNGLKLLYHDRTTEAAARTSHYVAYSSDKKKVVIGIQGTSSLDDAITDCCATPSPLHQTGDKPTLAHEAIADSANNIKDRVGPLLQDLFCNSHSGGKYEVVTTGHSLGAGTACLLAILLKEELQIYNCRAVGFATPPVVDRNQALACKDYITTMVNSTDCIPRASVRNFGVLGNTLEQLYQSKLDPADATAAVKSVAESCMSSRVARKTDLYVPGKVVLIAPDGAGGHKSVVSDGDMPPLNFVVPSPSLVSDHLTDPYEAALAGAVAQYQAGGTR